MHHRLTSTLQWLYALFLLVMPVVAAVVVVRQAETLGVSPGEVDFLLRSFFLVGLFNLFFLVLYHANLPTKITTLCGLLFGPIIAAVGHALVADGGFWFTLAEAGMIYTIEIMLAFTILMVTILGIAVSASVVHKDPSTLVSGILLCGLQLLFLIPGGGAVYIFSKIIIHNVLAETAATHGMWSALAILSYALVVVPIIQNIWAFFHHLKDESIIG